MISSKRNVQVLSSVILIKSDIRLCFSFLIVCLLLVANSSIQAQNLKEKKEVLAQLDTKKVEKLNSLLNDIQPTIYLENGEMKVFGDDAPVYVKTDIGSIKKLAEKNSKYAGVEILQIKLNKLGEESKLKLTPSDVSGLPNLKYIIVRSSYEVSKKKFEDIFLDFNSTGITIFYEVVIPN